MDFWHSSLSGLGNSDIFKDALILLITVQHG